MCSQPGWWRWRWHQAPAVAPGYRCPWPRSQPLRCTFMQADTSPALNVFSPPKKIPALSRNPHLPREGGEILPLPQRVSIELFQLHQPVVFTANIAQHFGSLASLECKTSPTETFFSCKANTLSVTRNIFLRHEQRVRFLQTKEPKVSFY